MFIPDSGSGFRIQGSKKHWIPDPQHRFLSNAMKSIDLEAMYAGGELFGEDRVLGRRGGEGGGDRGAGVAPRVQALVPSSPFQTYIEQNTGNLFYPISSYTFIGYRGTDKVISEIRKPLKWFYAPLVRLYH
jgi:hypothetical protein